MTGYYIDAGELKALAERLGATPAQMSGAYNRALTRTLAKYRKEALNLMLAETGAKNKAVLQRRVKVFGQRLAVTAEKPGTGKIWLGLNSIPVSMLKGRMVAQEERKRPRDSRGRFVRMGARGATFEPASSSLATLSFPDSFVGIVRGRRSIWQRNGRNNSVNEAAVPIHAPVNRAIRADMQHEINAELLRRFEQDLRGRIAAGIS